MSLYKFDFVLDSIDVENLFGCVTDSITKLMEDIQEEMVGQNRPEYIDYYKERIEYLKTLATKCQHHPIE